MRFYNNQRKYYCGIDLHTRKMYVAGIQIVLRHLFNGLIPEARQIASFSCRTSKG
jgi:hypothetical protein